MRVSILKKRNAQDNSLAEGTVVVVFIYGVVPCSLEPLALAAIIDYTIFGESEITE